MNIITQDLRFRQSVVKYYFRNGATATAAQYKVSRKTVYRWVNKYVPSKCLTKELKDQERFYYNKIFYSFEDLINRSKYWIKEYNNFPMRPLGWMSPKEKWEEYKSQKVA